MSASLENRLLRLQPLYRQAHAIDALYITGGTIALLAPRFVGTGAFSTMSFGSTSLVLGLACLIVALLSLQIPQRHKAPTRKIGTGPHASPRPPSIIPFLFLCACALFIFFECGAFAFAISGGYDPSRSWTDSPAHHIEQILAYAILMAFCLLLFSRSDRTSPDGRIQTGSTQNFRSVAFCATALFLAGVCLAGLPLLGSHIPFGSLSKPTVSYLFTVIASSIIALLASSLLWRCAASSKVAPYLSFFFCGAALINLGQHDMPILPPQPFDPPICFAATATVVSILTLCACLKVTYVETSSRPESDITLATADSLFEAPFDRLSNRERQVLLLSAKGHTVHSIAQELGIATTTISTYKSRMSKKLQLSWQAIVDRSGIGTDNNESKTREFNGSRAPRHKVVDHQRISSVISLAAGFSFTLLLNCPQPTPIFAELFCIAGVLFLLAFSFRKEGDHEPLFGRYLPISYLLPVATSSLSACAISHIPDGRMTPFSLDQHLLFFLLAWCTVTALDHFWSQSASRATDASTLDKNRVRSYLNSKGIQGMYLEVAIATLNGTPASEIARNLCISTSTVTSYRARIYAKLHVCGREGLFQLLKSELT